jgi:hypothetical protein
MNFVKHILLAMVALLGNNSCTEEIETITISPNQAQEVSLTLSQEKTVAITGGTEATKSVSIKFASIKDRRCAVEDCSLCYGSEALVFLAIRSGDAVDSLTFRRFGCIGSDDLKPGDPLLNQQQIQGLSIGLINLSDKSKKNPVKTHSIKLLIKTL